MAWADNPITGGRPKDSIDYTIDDGKMSKAEMEEEARSMQQLCALNPYQSNFFDCDCVAGAFLLKRGKNWGRP